MSTPVRSVSHAFAILRLLAESAPLSLSDIGRHVELSPSSCFNLLKTLLAEGVIERDPRTKFYRLVPAWSALDVLRDGGEQAFIDRALPLMHRFADTNDAAVGLWKIISRHRLQLIAHSESQEGMRLRLADAQRQPLGAGAVGRALAAAQGIETAELARRYAPVRWHVNLPFDAYAQQVRDAADRGFAIDSGFAHRRVSTVAAAMTARPPGYCVSASIFAGPDMGGDLDSLGGRLCALKLEILAG